MVNRDSRDVKLYADHGLAYDYRQLFVSMQVDANGQHETLELRGTEDFVVTCTSTTEVITALRGLVTGEGVSSHPSEIGVRAIFKSQLEFRFSFTISFTEFGLPIELTFEDESILLLCSKYDHEANWLPR
jgi:hypothetical protein